MIQHSIFDEVYSDYLNSHSDKETLPHLRYNEGFRRWFQSNAKVYEPHKDVNTSLCPKDSRYGGRCFGNAQTVTLHQQLPYCEGFMLMKRKGYYLHGFNLIATEVLDCTVICNQELFDEYNDHPISYCGVIIPTDFVQKYCLEVVLGSPLLWEYYSATVLSSAQFK